MSSPVTFMDKHFTKGKNDRTRPIGKSVPMGQDSSIRAGNRYLHFLDLGTYHSQEKSEAQPVMTFVCRYSSRPRTPYSLPNPLCLKPPKEASVGMALEQFFQTI